MINETLTVWGLFLEGLLAFFSPCVLPLIPLYLGYLTSDIDPEAPKRQIRKKTMLVTLCFVLGISTVFLLAALGIGAFQAFFKKNELVLQIIGGILLIVFGLFSLDVIKLPWLNQEHRMTMPKRGKMSYWNAFLMGFFFSFAWTPCIGPLLASAIVMAANAATRASGYLYIFAFSIGFLIMFLLLGLFTEEILQFLKKKQGVVKYTKIIGSIIILVMGFNMLFNSLKAVNNRTQSMNATTSQKVEKENDPKSSNDTNQNTEDPSKKVITIDDENFTLETADGTKVSLQDYKGKVIVINFFGTWCPYCMKEMPEIQKLQDDNDDVQVLLVNVPNNGREGTIESVEQTMKDKGYNLTILYDTDGSVTQKYGVSGFPTTYVVKPDGTYLGYVPGYVDPSTWSTILEKARQ